MPRRTCSVIAARQTDSGLDLITLTRGIPTRIAMRARWQRGGGYDPTYDDACDRIGLDYVGVAIVESGRVIATAGDFPLTLT